MKPAFTFVLVLAVQTATICSQRVTLIGSHLLPTDSSYKAFLSTNNLGVRSSVDVSLFASNSPTYKNLQVPVEGSFNEVEFQTIPESNDYELKVSPKSSNKCSSAKLIKTSDRPLIFIQFTKPFYKIGDDFSFRIFFFNQKMLPYKGTQSINVKILDSRNGIFKKFDNIEISEFGVYENTFKLSDIQNLGKWKIQVESADRKVTKRFNVEQPNRDNLEIFIEMAPMLSYSDKRAYMNIYVKDRSNKFFTGVAKIYVSGKLKESTRTDFGRKLVKTIELVGRKNGVGINYDEDIGISPPSDMMLNFDVEVIDPVTKRFIKTSKIVELKSNSRNTIHLVKKKFFKPGFKFPMKVKVKTLDGSPDNSFNKLSMTVEYHNKGSGIDKKQFQLNLKNGEISAPLNPTSDTTNIIVNFEFSGAKLTEIIDPLPTMGANEYMQVTVTSKANTVGDKVKYQVQTTEEMESLHVLVIGINGIVHYEEYPDAVGKDLFDFSVQLTEEMKPESRGIAFYIRPSDGILVYDEFVVTVTFGIENLLEISAPEAGKPNEQIDINVKTLKGSKVFLTATDQISPLLIRDNEISRSDIYNELIYYLNYRFPNTSLYNFEKFNGFILQPLTEGHTCGRESAEYTTNEESDDEENLNSEAKYFPNVWFDKSFDATSDAITPNSFKLPNSLTTWRYYGISVHKTKGFTVAKIQPKTAVKSEIVVQVKAPPTISDNEIVWVDVNVFNTMQENLRSDVLINIENGVIVEVNDVREFNLLCTKFTTRNQKDVKLVKNLLPQKKTEIIKIPIKSTGNGHIKVKVKAIAGNYNDEATKTIAFENAEEPAHTNNNFETNVYTQELQNSQVKIEIEGKVLRKDIKSSNTIVLDVELPRGFKYITHEENDKIDYFEIQDDSSIIVFYLKNLRPNQIFKQVIKAAKVYDFDVHKPSMVFSYDLNLPDEKDVTYYSFDKNTERCDKIEVMKWKNKALDAQSITKEAQESVKKSRDKITKAQQILANAQNKLKQAENKVKEAEQKALEADIKSQDAFKKAEDAWHDAEQARQTKPKNVVQSVPNNSIEEPVNETPTNAADAQKIAKAAQELADKAQNEAVEAQDGVTSANDEFETAKQEAKKALQDLIDAQKDANKSSNEVKELQKDTNAVKAKVNDAQNKVKTAQQNVVNAQIDVDEATAEVNKIQHEIDDALQVVSNAINKANKATKYTDIEQDVLNAEKISQEAKTFAQKANRVENDIVQKIQRPSNAVDQEIENVQKLFSYCNSLLTKAISINNGATKVQQIISSGVFIFTNNVKRFESAKQKFVDAEQLAKVTKEKADRLRQYSQRKAADASKLEAFEQSTRRTTSRFPSRYTTKYPTYTSSLQNIPTKTSQHWQPQSTSNQQWNPQPTPAIITTTQFYLQDVQDEYYQPNGDNRNVQSTGQSDITACSRWYRFCSFGL